MSLPMPSKEVMQLIRKGVVIPASPLALDDQRRWDQQHQRAVYRYYAAAGAGGIAVGVHTTQFEIREPGIGLFEPLLKFAALTIEQLKLEHSRTIIKIAGVCGLTKQAIAEAEFAQALGYDAVLLSLAAFKSAPETEILDHCRKISQVTPIIGFYLQPAVGGRILSFEFWRQFAEIENVIAIKMAPFNRYQTLDVIRGVAHSNREKEITLYTGNDDNIIMDLLTPYRIMTPQGEKVLQIKGGLLGQWAVWTKKAVELLDEIHAVIDTGHSIPSELLSKNIALTDANAVVFDAAHQFAGCIPGIYEVLRRQGLLANNYCLNLKETLSPGQEDEINRIYQDYPFLTDDEFIQKHIKDWLS